MQEIQNDLRYKLENMSNLICQQITTDGGLTRGNILSTEQKIEADLLGEHTAIAKVQEKYQDEMRAAFVSESKQLKESRKTLECKVVMEGEALRKLMTQVGNQINDKLSVAIKEHKAETDSVFLSINEVTESISNQNENIDKQVSRILEQQRKLSFDSRNAITGANKDLVHKVEQFCASMLEEVRNTAENYQRMEQDEQENLEKIRALSSEMLELGEHQKRIMEQLSQLCQDSDQFMDIQISINNMWEIMKAVWVDSLLRDYEKGLFGKAVRDGAESKSVEQRASPESEHSHP